MKVLALTGSIACGKSIVAEMLSELGAVVVDSDKVSRDAVSKGNDILEKIKEAFGKFVLNPDGSLNRTVMGEIVFNSPNKMKLLNSIIHPAIIDELKKEIKKNEKAGTKILIIEVPLLYEVGFKGLAEKVIVVHSDEDKQIKRLMERNNLSYNEAVIRIKSQIPSAKKAEMADYVVNNNSDADALKAEVGKLWEEISK